MEDEGFESVKDQEDSEDSRVRYTTRIFWVTPRTELSRVTSTFAHYGNELDIGYLYGDIQCLVVKLAGVGGGSDKDVATSSESDGYY